MCNDYFRVLQVFPYIASLKYAAVTGPFLSGIKFFAMALTNFGQIL